MAVPIFDHAHPKSKEITFRLPEFAPTCKKRPVSRLATPISDYAHPKLFGQILIYVNLHQHAKDHAISLICSGDMID